MSQPLCLLCSKPFAIIQQHAGPKQKRFCTDACNTAWWNEQPLHPVIPKVDAAHPRAVELRLKRTQLVTLEKADPYTYGYIPDPVPTLQPSCRFTNLQKSNCAASTGRPTLKCSPLISFLYACSAFAGRRQRTEP